MIFAGLRALRPARKGVANALVALVLGAAWFVVRDAVGWSAQWYVPFVHGCIFFWVPFFMVRTVLFIGVTEGRREGMSWVLAYVSLWAFSAASTYIYTILFVMRTRRQVWEESRWSWSISLAIGLILFAISTRTVVDRLLLLRKCRHRAGL